MLEHNVLPLYIPPFFAGCNEEEEKKNKAHAFASKRQRFICSVRDASRIFSRSQSKHHTESIAASKHFEFWTKRRTPLQTYIRALGWQQPMCLSIGDHNALFVHSYIWTLVSINIDRLNSELCKTVWITLGVSLLLLLLPLLLQYFLLVLSKSSLIR